MQNICLHLKPNHFSRFGFRKTLLFLGASPLHTLFSSMITKKRAALFQTVHNLAFEIAPWERSPDFLRYRVGTCHGLWRSTDLAYDILAIDNDLPGNGHLEAVFQWFEHSCRRDKKALRILHILNPRFMRHLVEKRGFTAVGDHCIKVFG